MKSILHLHLESNVADPDLPDSLNFSGSKSVSTSVHADPDPGGLGLCGSVQIQIRKTDQSWNI